MPLAGPACLPAHLDRPFPVLVLGGFKRGKYDGSTTLTALTRTESEEQKTRGHQRPRLLPRDRFINRLFPELRRRRRRRIVSVEPEMGAPVTVSSQPT